MTDQILDLFLKWSQQHSLLLDQVSDAGSESQLRLKEFRKDEIKTR